MTWSSVVLNEYVAPGYSDFLHADIRDLREELNEAPHWLANHFLNSVLRARYRPGIRQLALGYLRRVTGAFDAYHRARDLTLAFLKARSENEQPVRQYYAAIDAWEDFFLQGAMALDLFRALNAGEGAFAKNDGSRFERLYTIANQIKHVASCIESGQCTDKDTLAVTMMNDGLTSFGVRVSFAEASSILLELGQLADRVQDPLTPAAVAPTSREPGPSA